MPAIIVYPFTPGTPAYDMMKVTYLVTLVIIVPFGINAIRKLRLNREKTKNWITWRAKVLELEFLDIEPTSKMQVCYTYEYKDKQYKNHIATLADLEEHPDWHLTDGYSTTYIPDVYDCMRQAKKCDGFIEIWLNPDNPKESVITNTQFKGAEWFAMMLLCMDAGLIYFLLIYDPW